ncbi:MAG: hypothetical protein LBB43_04105, partial [Spirochaetaceae bacterium]|nr:hypothetical protein [Spirochaetaceae bacterium]
MSDGSSPHYAVSPPDTMVSACLVSGAGAGQPVSKVVVSETLKEPQANKCSCQIYYYGVLFIYETNNYGVSSRRCAL